MSNLDEIRERDRRAIPRMGDLENDPLLRAEMDRRWLLREIDRLTETVGAFSAARDAAKKGWQEAKDRNERVEALAEEMAGQHGQCWNSITARRIRDALRGGE